METTAHKSAPFGLARSEDRIVGGVSGGIAFRTGIAVIYIRAAFIVLTLVWGLGLFLYVAAFAATIDVPTVEQRPDAGAPEAGRRAEIGAGLILLAGLMFLRAIGIWPGDGLIWPAAATIFGAAALSDSRGIDTRDFLTALVDPADSSTRRRSIVGVLMLVTGLTIFGSTAVPQLGTTLLAVLITGVGLTVLFGPWIWRLANDLGAERSERVRQEERAEMAAHLHDSVLQTLTLIQRTDDPRRMVTLARGQERELRRWLYERAPDATTGSLSVLLQTTVDRIEADFDIPIDLVVAGGDDESDAVVPLVAAAGEAITNAAKHSGAAKVSVYAEVSPGAVDIWVADQGKGFDPSTVEGDRHGISHSILARMERHGGEAAIMSEPGEGTEVHLHIDREPAP